MLTRLRYLLKSTDKIYASVMYLNRTSTQLVHQNDGYKNCRQYMSFAAADKARKHLTISDFAVVQRMVAVD